MTEEIQRLIELIDEFPKRVRIDYDENDDRIFCNNVLTALKNAGPQIKEAFSSPVPDVAALLPTSTFQSPPVPERSIHIQGPTLDTPQPESPVVEVGGTVAEEGRILGTSDKPEVVESPLDAARKAAAVTRAPKPKSETKANKKAKGGQPKAPPSIG